MCSTPLVATRDQRGCEKMKNHFFIAPFCFLVGAEGRTRTGTL